MDNPPEAVKAMAREIAARLFEKGDNHFGAGVIRAGEWDEAGEVQSAITAILETSELCAKLAGSAELWDMANDSVTGAKIAAELSSFVHLRETPHED
jgi:hypothetical protein